MKKLLAVALTLALMLSMTAMALAEGKTIVYWTMWNSTEPQGQAIQEAVDAYMKATGNVVDLQFKGRNGIREGLEPALEAGTTIDLFDEDLDRVNKQWGKYLLDLEELAKKNDYEASANAGLMKAVRDLADGTLKTIPYQPFVFNYFYNPEIFEKAGVTELPVTWEDFLAVCQKVKDAGFVPVSNDDAYIDQPLGYHLARLIGEKGVEKVVNEGLWAEEPAVLKTAQAFEDMATKGFFSPTISSSPWPSNQNGEFALGEAAMYLNGSWLPNEVKSVAGEDFVWGCFAYPELEGGVNGRETANFGGQVLAINAKSEVAEEAFEIIKYITKGEFDLKLSQMSLGIPADSNNTEWPAQMALVKPVMDALTDRWGWGAGIEANPDIFPIIKENIQKLMGGLITAQEFVDTLEAAAK